MAKESVAAVIRHPDRDGRLLIVQRPETPDEELLGVWGLPAASLKPGEDDYAALQRLGKQKLGAELRPLRMLAQGRMARTDYELEMRLYEALLEGEPKLATKANENVTLYTEWRWDKPERLNEGAIKGSLCCRLVLDFLKLA
jgi:8-oxo-dGTP pyrophosphatase MutT (NUDIX family)